jgi:hypothetical protein
MTALFGFSVFLLVIAAAGCVAGFLAGAFWHAVMVEIRRRREIRKIREELARDRQ